MSRPALSRAAIFEVALRLIDAEGVDALTMRRLAGELGVGTMSLYSHVPNKDDVLDGVVGTVAGEIELPPPELGWRESARFLLIAFRRVCRRHPHVVPLLVNRPPTSAEGGSLMEAGFELLRSAGVDEKMTAKGYRLALSYAIGFVSLETSGFFRATGPAVMSRAGDPEFPRTAEVAPYMVDWDADEEFSAGLDVLLDFLSGHTEVEDGNDA